MNAEEVRQYCITKKLVTESFPFGESTLVFKVAGKMFALLSLEFPLSINLKCDPEKAIELREHHPEITPGYHMNKKHWNTINIESLMDETLLKSLIDQSYNLVAEKLPSKDKKLLL
jgi:predicted DNA-binding protein (MmcQ/YjbR family)